MALERQLDPQGILKCHGIWKNTRNGKEQANVGGTSWVYVNVCIEKAAFKFTGPDRIESKRRS